MADTKTSALTAITSNTSGDLLYVSSGGNDRKITIDNFGIQGTFTATLTAATTPPTTPPTTTAYYTRVGNIVVLHISFAGVGADTTGAAGELQVTGIPSIIQTTASFQYGSVWTSGGLISSTKHVACLIDNDTIKIREQDSTTELDIVAGTGMRLEVNIQYRV